MLIQRFWGKGEARRDEREQNPRPIDDPGWVILQPSSARLQWMGVFMLVGHPLFAWIWSEWLPQPYEDWRLRAVMAAMGLLLMAPTIRNAPSSRLSLTVYLTVLWLQLPVLFSWMYLCNGGNTVWLASLCAMFLIYYQLTEWRVATLGLASGGILTWCLFHLLSPTGLGIPADLAKTHAVVIAFSWGSACWFGMGTSSVRQAQTLQALNSMRILAHELRTPLATIALLTDAAQDHGRQHGTSDGLLERMLSRLQRVVSQMHWQINTQVNNVQWMALDEPPGPVEAAPTVRKALAGFPYPTETERCCVQLVVHGDFVFMGHQRPFEQAMGNLLKNALNSLGCTGRVLGEGEVLITVESDGACGRIRIQDRGVGIEEKLQRKIFEPFFSTNHATGHGLGLAFTQKVVQAAGGTIKVQSLRGEGATFLVELPVVERVGGR